MPKRSVKAPQWMLFWCQCKKCLETFGIEALVSDGVVIELEGHPRVVATNGNYCHRCGGNGQLKRGLVLYASLKYL